MASPVVSLPCTSGTLSTNDETYSKVQVCDARNDEQRTKARSKKIFNIQESIFNEQLHNSPLGVGGFLSQKRHRHTTIYIDRITC